MQFKKEMQENYSDNLLDTKETTEIYNQNDSKNYFKEALEKEMVQREFEDESESTNKENILEENIPTAENIQEAEEISGLEQTKPIIIKKKKKTKAKTKTSAPRKSYQFLK